MNTTTKNYHTFLTDPWWAMGQTHPGDCGLMINETATRGRAGLLNIISGVTIVILLMAPELDPVLYVAPFVIFDMLAAATFGLTPFSPAGLFGTTITMKIKPVWKPTKPKRFAWILGATLGVCCLVFRMYQWQAGMIGVLGICFLLTWLEAVLGFCVGCWMYSLFFKCEVCELGEHHDTASAAINRVISD
ncbi:MAG TPA: DUF4395 domain-containing protein [Gammaproteobacteria bacterium]|nr:DUF4395 domain-containing protein [Gammaproteobacteria bacterium]